jgi:hypothetical protein
MPRKILPGRSQGRALRVEVLLVMALPLLLLLVVVLRGGVVLVRPALLH